MRIAAFDANRVRARLPGLTGLCRVSVAASLVMILWAFTACGIRDDQSGTPARGTNASTADVSTPLKPGGIAQILLFNGTGTSPNDVAAFETILKDKHVNYSKVNSSQLNAMSESQLRGYGLVIVPGGNFIDIGNGLTSGATANVRSAVQNGLNYLGVCAGAFFAGNSPTNGLNLTSDVKFGFYAAEDRGIRKAAVPIAVAGSPTLEHYWEDGPQLTGWGAVVGKYPDGSPAIVQGTCGNGWVILSGVHPEAPANWRRGMTFTTPVSSDNEYAWTLIHAALSRESLPQY
jgi:Biotin-protein ligase, N terminal